MAFVFFFLERESMQKNIKKTSVLALFFCLLSGDLQAARTLTVKNIETEFLEDYQKPTYDIAVSVGSQAIQIPYGASGVIANVPNQAFKVLIAYNKFAPLTIEVPAGKNNETICRAIDAYVGREYKPKDPRQAPCGG